MSEKENKKNEESSVFDDVKKDISNQVETEIRNVSKNTSLKTKVIILIVIFAILGSVLYFAYDNLFVNKGHKVSTVSVSTLTKIIETSNLSTLEYTYNAVTSVQTEDKNPTVMYYIAYEGTVTAGIDLEEVKVSIIDNNITVEVPEATIQSVNVNPGTLEYIFVKEKYNTEVVPSVAFARCKKDLEERANKESDLLVFAKENAVSAISALIEPWVNEVSSDYVVEVK